MVDRTGLLVSAMVGVVLVTGLFFVLTEQNATVDATGQIMQSVRPSGGGARIVNPQQWTAQRCTKPSRAPCTRGDSPPNCCASQVCVFPPGLAAGPQARGTCK